MNLGPDARKARSMSGYVKECRRMMRNGTLPEGIPLHPELIKGYGFRNPAHWFNTQIWPYHGARRFVRKLCVKSLKEWKDLVKSGTLPHGIPHEPDDYYREYGREVERGADSRGIQFSSM
jgi:hypothetical protein